MKQTIVTVLALCCVSSGGAVVAAEDPAPSLPNLSSLDVPLTIHDIAGVDRRQDVCSTGVPMPCGLLKEPEGVAVFDPLGKAVPAQFRVLERWRDKGEGKADLSIRWLLVTFLADVRAGDKSVYHLKAGKNPAPAAPVRAEDKGAAWELGGLSLPKDLSGPLQMVFTGPDDKPITAADLPVTWSVWEAGPVRACLKAESPTVPGKFGFIAWIYAFAGQKRWDMTVVLKNTPNDAQGPLYFKDFSVIWAPSGLTGAKDYLLGGEWGKTAAGTLDGNQTVYLHQDSDGTDHWRTFGKDGRLSPVLDWTADKSKTKAAQPAFRGYKVISGDKELSNGNFAAGWAALNSREGDSPIFDPRKSGQSPNSPAAFAAVRDYYQQYPKATEVAPGRIVLHLWPKYTRSFGGLHWLDDCTRKWHDVSLRISPSRLSAQEAEAHSKAFDFPLLAHAPVEWYRAAQAFLPSPEHARDKDFGGEVIKMQAGTGRNWVNFGGDITDQIRRRYHEEALGPFARTGDPGRAFHLYNMGRHSSGMTPLWLDEYLYPRDIKKLTHAQYCGLARDVGKYRPGTWHHGYMTWNDAHFCCQEVFDNWRLFGDPLALDALTTIGRWCQAYVDFREANPDKLIAGTRADGLPLYNLCEAYRILGDESMPKCLDRFADVCWKQVNKQRGNYGVMDSWEGGKDQCEKPFMVAQVIKGLRAYYELTGSQRTADQIYGMTDFIVSESSLGQWGFNYVVLIDAAKNRTFLGAKRAEFDKDGKNVSYGHIAWTMAWVYQHFGDERFRQAIDGLNSKADPHLWRAYTCYGPERMDRAPPEPIQDLSVEALGGGRVKLTWTAPKGAPVRYQVKWSDKPIVERLAWPEEKDSKSNWWSAHEVPGVPRPGAPGAKESLTVEGLPLAPLYFAVRSFDAASNRSAMSNQAVLSRARRFPDPQILRMFPSTPETDNRNSR